MISQDDFDIMVDELLNRKPVSFDMMCSIAQKCLMPTIKGWCNSEPCLNGRNYHDDIMQEVNIRLMKTVVNFFLLKDGPDGPVNNDPAGFNSWIYKVALNIKRDFIKKVRGIDYRSADLEDLSESALSTEDDYGDIFGGSPVLAKAFSVVISADVGVYKILTWVAQFAFITIYNLTKIQSNHKIIDVFENKTLYEMYELIYTMSKYISWIEIEPEQQDKILVALGKAYDDNRVYGEVRYNEFFMLSNGKKDGVKSISDWVNRINNMLRKKLREDYEAEIHGTGRDDDESSDF